MTNYTVLETDNSLFKSEMGHAISVVFDLTPKDIMMYDALRKIHPFLNNSTLSPKVTGEISQYIRAYTVAAALQYELNDYPNRLYVQDNNEQPVAVFLNTEKFGSPIAGTWFLKNALYLVEHDENQKTFKESSIKDPCIKKRLESLVELSDLYFLKGPLTHSQ